MERSNLISLTLPVLSTIGAATVAVIAGIGYLHNSAVDRFDRQSDIIAESLRAELASFKLELQKLDTDVIGVDAQLKEVDSSVAVADFQSELVKEDVIEVKDKVDVIGSDLDSAADKLAVIQSALIVGFKDNEAVKLILTDERLSLLLPEEVFSSEPQKAAALDGDSAHAGIANIEPKISIAEYCQSVVGPLSECYKMYLKKAEKKLLIGSMDE